ncbi:DUF5057 domain-containing protein [Paenibacillus shirakamiensis]|nr:DUF5057 domain-containing protein [Paenibacillus shirakamiensis]
MAYVIPILALLLLVTAVFFKVNAEIPKPYPLKILQIIDNNSTATSPYKTTDLTTLMSNLTGVTVTVEKVRMKHFVAMRDELDGKYDAIFVDTGLYSIAGVQGSSHETTDVMNDITKLKASQIVSSYINKGMLVMVHNDVMSKTDKKSNLYNLFAPFVTSPKSNVWFVGADQLKVPAGNKNTPLTDKLNANITLLKLRPRIDLDASNGQNMKPTDYATDQTKVYVAGDKLVFKFNVYNIENIKDRLIQSNLYLGIDKVLTFDENQMVASTSITGTSGEISYELPKAYSGLLYWRLDLVDQATKIKSYETGTIHFKDEKTVVRVLQILPGGENSSLLKGNNMNAAYLGSDSDDYKINLSVMQSSEFVTTGYKDLNGKYDMIVFGFRDEYNQFASLTAESAQAVHNFISTGQGVMFTHDTIFRDEADTSNKYWKLWVDNFQQDTGQIAPMTNLGLSAPNKSTSTTNVNDGLLTQYPFYLTKGLSTGTNERPLINLTHNQYFTLDLEDPTIVPWYNITGGKRDEEDSWNHFYTYSKGNVTYSGTGHTNSNFPDWEQRLFVNTMYRAFIGSNHAPTITVHAPLATDVIPSYQKLLVSYTANDLDLKDRNVTTGFKFIINGKETTMLPERSVQSGSVINMTFDNPLPEGGDMSIQIVARDRQGAESKVTVPIKIVKVTANLQTNRTLSANVINGKVEKNDTVTMHYTVTPKPIAYFKVKDNDQITIKNVQFSETLPTNLEIITLPVNSSAANFQKSGSLGAGYTISGNLNSIVYRLSADRLTYVADPISFDIAVKPTQNGIYTLRNSNLTFIDIGNSTTKSLQFPTYVFEAVTKLTKLTLDDYTLITGDKTRLIPRYEPNDASLLTYTWTSSNPEIVSVNENGIIETHAVGKAVITAKSIDGSNLTATSQITVIRPELIITGPHNVYKNQTISLNSSLILDGQNITSLKWTVLEGANFVQLSDPQNQWNTNIKGIASGKAVIGLVAQTESQVTHQKYTYNASYEINVSNPMTSIALEGSSEVQLGNQIDLKATFLPLDADQTPFTWKVTNVDGTPTTLASITTSNETAVLTGNDAGTVKVSVTAGTLTVEKLIDIRLLLQLPLSMTLQEGSPEYHLLNDLRPFGLKDTVRNQLIWTSKDSTIVKILNPTSGVIIAGQRGITAVTVTLKDHPNITATIVVKVDSKETDDRY